MILVTTLPVPNASATRSVSNRPTVPQFSPPMIMMISAILSIIMRSNPFFIDGSDQTAYQAAKQAYQAAAAKAMTVDDFNNLMDEAIAVQPEI